ncbi:Endoprotease FURIN, putative [Acanthamoeba castellanii str. Neff]|uniref:Endoprotease FURIN, putative n=1 Tax=Acanthamoeba castellanii (strain ATCC 30010 / Neff) TaxID=1257118 RepID=L8GHA3_ACACF|nr:Endoprotease FURIN, putative [Acanthamoeba castellanii str. Neff]ELR11566.1 Endoprotease FURIN, putative [Acanthamoeba castellanii str. Neff]
MKTALIAITLLCLALASIVVMGDELEEQQQQPQWAVKVEEGHNPDEVAEQHGFINLGPVANLKNYFLFEARHQNKRSTQHAATSLAEHPGVSWMEEQEVKQHEKKRRN